MADETYNFDINVNVRGEENIDRLDQKLGRVQQKAQQGVNVLGGGTVPGTPTAIPGTGGAPPQLQPTAAVGGLTGSGGTIQQLVNAELAAGRIESAQALAAQYSHLGVRMPGGAASGGFVPPPGTEGWSQPVQWMRTERFRGDPAQRQFDAAQFAQFRQQERAGERFQNSLDRANLSLEKAREKEAQAAEKMALAEEERLRRATMRYDVSQQATRQGRAQVFRDYAAQYPEGSPEQLDLMSRANEAERTSGQRGRFSGLTGLSIGLFVATLELRRALQPLQQAQQARIASEGATMDEQFKLQQALLASDTTDPLRYYTQAIGSNLGKAAQAFEAVVPGLSKLGISRLFSGYVHPDDAQRDLQEAQKTYEAAQKARQIQLETDKIRDEVGGMTSSEPARAAIINKFRETQRQAEVLREQAKNVAGPEAMSIENRSREMESAARQLANEQLIALRSSQLAGSQAAILQAHGNAYAASVAEINGAFLGGKISSAQTIDQWRALYAGTTRQAGIALAQLQGETYASSLARTGNPLSGRLAGIDARYGTAFANLDPSNPMYHQQVVALRDARSEENRAARQEEDRRLILIQSMHESAQFALSRNPLGAQLRGIIGQRDAKLVGVTNDAEIARINQAARDEAIAALVQRADQTQLLNINQAGRGRQLDALLNRDPFSAEVAGAVSQARSEEARLRQSGFASQADTARELGIKQLQLLRQNYTEGFSAVQTSQEFAWSLLFNKKDAEDPLTVLRNIDSGIKDLGQPGTVAGREDLPALFQTLLGKLDEFKALIIQ